LLGPADDSSCFTDRDEQHHSELDEQYHESVANVPGSSWRRAKAQTPLASNEGYAAKATQWLASSRERAGPTL